MIKLTFENNSADGIYACALAIPTDKAGIEVLIEASTKYIRIFEGEYDQPTLVRTHDGKYVYTLPQSQCTQGKGELVLIAEIVEEYYKHGENAPQSGKVADGVVITPIE